MYKEKEGIVLNNLCVENRYSFALKPSLAIINKPQILY